MGNIHIAIKVNYYIAVTFTGFHESNGEENSLDWHDGRQ
jgi:hypothetical protein